MRWTRCAPSSSPAPAAPSAPAPTSPAAAAPSRCGTTATSRRSARPAIRSRSAIFNCLKPIVAAINGAAVGVGITMCLPMDVRMMSSAARIGFVFNKRGMAMEAGSCWFLPRLVGMQRAQEWVMTAELFGAEEALKGGLVRSVHAPDELLPAAQALAQEVRRQHLVVRRRRGQPPADVEHAGRAGSARRRHARPAMRRLPRRRRRRAGRHQVVLREARAGFPAKPSKDMPPFGPWA